MNLLHKSMLYKSLLKNITLIAIFMLFSFSNSLLAQEDKTSIILYSSNVEFTYHQPFRNGYKSNHPSYIEVPKLNQILNMLQNYIQYLKKLGRVNGSPNIRISYAPDSELESDEVQTRIIKINDLGLASIINKTNRYLTEYGFVKVEDILDNPSAVQDLPEQDITKSSNFCKSAYFNNISIALPSNEPDTNYEIADSQTVFTTRPSKKTNLIYKLSLSNEADNGPFSDEAEIWYQKMKISSDQKYLALTDGLVPYIIDLSSKEKSKLYPDKDNISLLDYVWSPVQNILVGIVIDEKTENRQIFMYDAEKKEMLDIGGFSKVFEANYLYAMPIWSNKGNKLAFISSKSISIIDLIEKKAQANIVNVEGEIAEFIWSEDAESFAFVEVKGQARSQYHFDDYDFKGCVLHRYRFVNSMFSAAEDYAQCIESRNTIKIISFTDKDQILYLEGKLVAPDIPGSYWDLSKTFKAFLTPLPTEVINAEGKITNESVKPQQLPMQYLYVFRSQDSKNANIYDSGNGHSNLLYTEDFYSSWFIGLYLQGGIYYKGNVYNYRNSPYPFQCDNYAYFMDMTKGHVGLLMKFLKDYNIRSTDSDPKQKKLFMQANFSGILNIWSIDTRDLFNYLINGDKEREVKKEPVKEEVSVATQTQKIRTMFDENNFDDNKDIPLQE